METQFPPKPPLPKEAKPSTNRSVMSLLLFVVLFFILFGQDIQFLIVMLGVLAIHELGHFISMQRKDYKDSKLFFVPVLNSYLSGEKKQIPQKDRIQVILAGPVPGIFMGISLLFVSKQFDLPDLLLPAQIFLFLNLFNLLPFNPLDGGRLLDTAYPQQSHAAQLVSMIIVASILAMLAVLSANYFLLIVPLVLIFAVNGRMRIDRIRKTLQANGINLNQSYEELSDVDYGKIRSQLIQEVPLFKNNLSTGQYDVSSPLEMRMQAQIHFFLQPPMEEELDAGERRGLLILWILLFIAPLVLAAMWSEPASLNP